MKFVNYNFRLLAKSTGFLMKNIEKFSFHRKKEPFPLK